MVSSCIAFAGATQLASGSLKDVALAAKRAADHDDRTAILVFDAVTSDVIEIDLRGTSQDVLARLLPDTEAPRRPGRPKLGVVAREVTLLPRHWDWLNSQPGGASVALRRLVDAARRAGEGKDRIRAAQEAAYRFMTVMAGNEAGYEEALRALFAGDPARFRQHTLTWPPDVREHTLGLAGPAFSTVPSE